MKNLKKLMAAGALTLAAVSSLTLLAGCGGSTSAVQTTSIANKVLATYDFNDMKGNADEVTNLTVKGYGADGKADETLNATLTSELSGVRTDGTSGSQAWNATVGGLVLPGFSTVTTETGFSVSAWIYNATGDWNQFLFTYAYDDITETNVFVGVSCGNVDPFGLYGTNFFPSKTDENGLKVTAGPAINNDLANYDLMCAEGGPMDDQNRDTWIYVTVTFDARGISFYRNGQLGYLYGADLVFEGTDGTSMGDYVDVLLGSFTAAPTTVEGVAQGTTLCGGAVEGVDDVVISYALTDDEVLALYNEQVAAQQPAE